jgi:peptidyl-prolyl cis-trans isomerase SurA
MLSQIKTFFLLLIGLSLFPLLTHAHTSEELDSIAAFVNDGFISRITLENKIAAIQSQSPSTTQPPLPLLRKHVLETLIQEKIILDYAKATHMQLPAGAVNEEVQRLSQENHLSPEDFLEKVPRAQLEKELLIQYTEQRDIIPHIQVSQEQINEFISLLKNNPPPTKFYQLGHILIPLSEDASLQEQEESKLLAKNIVSALQKGSNFATMAKKHSHDSVASSGGLLGWRAKDEIPSLFTNIVPRLAKEEIYGPIMSNSGLHIIKLLDTRPDPKKAPANLSPTTVHEFLVYRAFEERLPRWRSQLRAKAYVKIVDHS